MSGNITILCWLVVSGFLFCLGFLFACLFWLVVFLKIVFWIANMSVVGSLGVLGYIVGCNQTMYSIPIYIIPDELFLVGRF